MSSQEEEAVASELAALLRQVGEEGAATEEVMGSAEFSMPEEAISYSRDTQRIKGTSSPSVIGRTRSLEGEEGERIPQQVDRDVVTFTQDLEGALHSVVQSAGRYLWGVKERLRHEGLAANERYRKDHAEEMIRLHKGIHSHAMDLEKAEAEASGMRQKVASVQEKSIQQRRRREGHHLQRLVFSSWKTYVAIEARRRRAVMLAKLQAARRRASMRWFHRWARATLESKLERETTSHARSLEGISKEIVRKYESELARLRAELAMKQQELEREVAKRHRTKEELHRTFLKGWTNMNLEALALLGQQSGLDCSATGVESPNANASLAAFEQLQQNGTVPNDEQPRPPLALEPSRQYEYSISPS